MVASIERVIARLVAGAAGLRHGAGLPLLRAGGERQLRASPSPTGAARSSSTPATSGPRTPSATCWRCRAAAARASQWLTTLAPHWEGSNNLQHHLWWHCALFHLEHGDTARVLELYDQRFRNLAAPLTVATPDLYIDVQNAASMLFRLQRLGVDVGNRWEELADKAEARIGDCLSAFTLPHWMMALLATGRTGRGRAHGRGHARSSPTAAARSRLSCATTCCRSREAQLAHAAGRHREALDLMRPALGGMYRLGGSHAQQDVLEQLFLDAAIKADSTADIRLALERVAGRRAIPPERFIGWRDATKRVRLDH